MHSFDIDEPRVRSETSIATFPRRSSKPTIVEGRALRMPLAATQARVTCRLNSAQASLPEAKAGLADSIIAATEAAAERKEHEDGDK